MPKQNDRPGMFDIPYGLASAALTDGLTVVATTGAGYHGISIVAGATSTGKVIVYDNASATSGNIVDIIVTKTGGESWIDRYIPVQAKNGLTVSATGTIDGAIFYSPKG